MEEENLATIRNYLLTKKLPIDILMEVQDHFVSQIEGYQRNQHLSFSEAFAKTEKSWEKELRPYWKGEMNLEDVSDFMRKMTAQINKNNFLFALKWSGIPFFLIYFSAILLPAKLFGIFVLAVLSILIAYALCHYILNFSDFRLLRKYPNHVITLHQHSVFIFVLVLSPMLNIFGSFLEHPAQLQEFLLLKRSIWQFFGVLIPILIIVGSVFFSLSAQKNYLKQIEKVKPFLKYLQPVN